MRSAVDIADMITKLKLEVYEKAEDFSKRYMTMIIDLGALSSLIRRNWIEK